MACSLCLVVGMALPRVVPVPQAAVRQHLELWREAAVANEDAARANRLAASLARLDHEDLGHVAVELRGTLTAIASLTRQDGATCLTSLESNDASSGSLLLKALVRTANVSVRTEDDRWKVAAAYHRPAADE